MKLIIRRDQADMKGLLGGHKGVQFSLWYRLSTTAEEDATIARYRLGGHMLTRSQTAITTVDAARSGVTQTLPSVEVLLENESVIRAACQQFGVLLAVAQSFGGEEVVEIESSIRH